MKWNVSVLRRSGECERTELPGDWEYDPESGCVYCSVG